MKIGILLALFMLVSNVQQTSSWEFRFEKDGIKVYTRKVDGSSFDSFKGEALLNIAAEKIKKQILSVESYPNWCYRTTETKVQRWDGNKVYYRYVSETPPMVRNREAYFCSELLPTDTSGTIIIAMKIVPSEEPIPEGFVRMPAAKGFWKLYPKGENKTFVEFEMQAEPGGIIPGWLANMASSESPYVTIKNLVNILTE